MEVTIYPGSEMAEEKSIPSQMTRLDTSVDATTDSSDEAGVPCDDRAELELEALGYQPELQRNRSLFTLLFQSLAIAAIPFGEGGPLISAIYGGGPRSIFVGWLVILVVDSCVGISIGEIASRYPTSAGPYYWSFQLAKSNKVLLSFVTGWIWLMGNITIALSVNFGFASLISATISIYHPEFIVESWMLLLIFYAICLGAFAICALHNRYLPLVDTICAAWTLISILVICVSLSVEAKAGRHSIEYALTGHDESFSGWGDFTFFIGLLPAAYTFSAIGMISSMAEECQDPTVQLPRAISLCVPVGGIAGMFFILPICFTLPPLVGIIDAPAGQALPYIFHRVMGSSGGALGLMSLVFVITMFCSISITTAASRTTWAFARDNALPLSWLWSRVNKNLGVPFWALMLVTIVQMLLGIIEIGSSSAFTAFVSVGVIGLGVSYAIPITISLYERRYQVQRARWHWGPLIGTIVNVVSVVWISFELVLFSMPTTLPVTPHTMNYAIVVFCGFLSISAVWYVAYARKVYKGPPTSDAL